MIFFHFLPVGVVADATAANLVARCFIIRARNTLKIVMTSPTIKRMLNVTGLGYVPSTLSTVISIVDVARITVVITGPIAPPTILIIFVIADEIPVYSLGVMPMITLIKVVGKSAPAIPKIKREEFMPAEE